MSKNEYKSVLEIFSEIDKILSFTECFKHYKVKNISKKPAKEIFYGGIFGLGTNMGLHRLSNTSKGINYNTLYNTVNWYFTVENLSTINKSFIQFMSKLWLPTLF
ncbi:transposase [Candidatus Bandiella numerosa]|uniref:Tn3 family transposase n=1 Tax=Candidatus Bandiella numerosa TaxID=2570586 RepID=UPI00249DF83D|nr:Tn3 family transposase [Candidatus Bandiella numerosa]WHA04558.1 transposase [Candidatus Bandiella numerosa]